MLDKLEKSSPISWLIVLLLIMISVGTAGILNKLSSVEEELATHNKNYNNVLVRLSANESRDTDQDARINNQDSRVNKLEVKAQ